MSAFTFTSTMLQDMTYEINDQDIANDILLIEGESGSEQLIRGISQASIDLFGRRSKRIERPLSASEATGETLVEDQLDQYCCENGIVPARVNISFVGKTDNLVEEILTREISDVITLQITTMGMNEDYYVDGITINIESGYLAADYQLIQKMGGV
jgi:hypothetical protein